MKTVNLKNLYHEIQPKLLEQFKLSNVLALPRIEKAVVNVGIGIALRNESTMKQIRESIALITGQQPVMRQSRRAISGFKIRKGDTVGLQATLRGDRMWWFLERFIKVALPRVRDFRGIPIKSIDPSGNITIGIKEQTIFPEVEVDRMPITHGLEITIVLKNTNPEKTKILLKEMGFPIK